MVRGIGGKKINIMQATELIPGKVYRDISERVGESTYLKFVKNEDGRNYFEYVGGEASYIGLYKEDNLISFSEHSELYELEPNETY